MFISAMREHSPAFRGKNKGNGLGLWVSVAVGRSINPLDVAEIGHSYMVPLRTEERDNFILKHTA